MSVVQGKLEKKKKTAIVGQRAGTQKQHLKEDVTLKIEPQNQIKILGPGHVKSHMLQCL